VNNTCFLDTALFDVTSETEKRYDAVYNAKALAFKRHYLTENLRRKAFISYDVNEADECHTKSVDLIALAPDKIYQNISPEEVRQVIHSSYVGLILSEVEGACYASTEYLLCGIPVVSTAALGGRTDYYNDCNSIICDPSPKAVADAVALLKARVQSNDICANLIRQACLDRMDGFRSAFKTSLAGRVAELNLGIAVEKVHALIKSELINNNKLRNSRNFWTKKVIIE
jgi:glycosyltransferase involved in cell wall biosynthesis